MQDDVVVDPKLSSEDADALVHRVMWRQAKLSLKVAAIFIAILILLPLFNLIQPQAAATPILGFPLTWLILGLAFYPITWMLSAFFVKQSDLIEASIVREEIK